MSISWRTFFGFSDDHPGETYDEAVARAKHLMDEGNHEDACHILKYAEKQNHAEAMYLLAWCCWRGEGIQEDAGRAIALWRKSAALGFAPAAARSEELKAAAARAEQRAQEEDNA